ncbi:hypothetical protein GFS31_30330 [Leptolyngbya sp. BL0902]|nr:hypothetical protein GFS31_30330 [Leptolyngbya sp. BL0902]
MEILKQIVYHSLALGGPGYSSALLSITKSPICKGFEDLV